MNRDELIEQGQKVSQIQPKFTVSYGVSIAGIVKWFRKILGKSTIEEDLKP